MATVIETENLFKTYEGAVRSQDVVALRDLSITVEEGEIFAYLGPNGSGKTTTVKLLLGLIFPTSGSIRVLGRSDIGSPDVKRRIGYLPEGAYYPDFLRGEEVLKYYGRLYGLYGKDLTRRVDAVIETVGMERARKRLIRNYSKGMRQRIGLAQALISDPQLLILDEPTTGLDPIARKEIRDVIVRLRDEGKTILLSSHELLEVELISNRVGILFEGDLKTLGTVDELLALRDTAIRGRISEERGVAALAGVGMTVDEPVDGVREIHVPSDMPLYEALDRCRDAGVQIDSIAPRRETLEELFIRTVGAASVAKEKEALA